MTVQNPELISLKLGQAPKAGKTARGLLSYRVLCDADRQSISLALVANEGGGWFSPELVPLARIEAMLTLDTGENTPMPVNVLRAAFVSRSANNPGFLAAVLLAEGLLQLADGASRRYVRADGWDTWKALMLSEPGESFLHKAQKQPALVVKEGLVDNSQGEGKKRKKSRSSSISVDASPAQEEVGDEVVAVPREFPDHDSEKPEELDDAPSE